MRRAGADPLVLVLDAGSGGGRCSIYDARGERRAHAERAWHATTPPALAPFGREYDPEALGDSLDAAALEALAGVRPEAIAAIACTGQRIACAFLDADGRALYAGPNGDVRALAGASLDALDEATVARTGRFPPWIFAPARLAWFREAEPATYAAIRRVVGLPGWAAHRLTGASAADATVAADLLMLDVATRAPLALDAPEGAWPRLAAPTDRLGELAPRAAARLGLPAGIPVAVGCADTQAALLLGGTDTLVAGSSAPLARQVDEPLRDPAGRLWLDPRANPDGFALEANLGEMGTAHRWLLELLALPSFDAFDALARRAAAGARGATSHLGPRAMDLRALNTARPAGLLLPFGETSLRAPPGRAELARSFLESCAFAARAGRAWLDAVKPAPEEVHLVGGMSRSALLGDVLASVLATPVLRGPFDATARGAAACAMVAGGLAPTLDEALERLRREPARHEPSREDDYDDAWERWLEREQLLEET